MKSRFSQITGIVLLITAMFSTGLHAQNDMKEIGLRLGASGSDFVFKKEKKPNKFLRYRAGLNNLGLLGSDNFIASVNFGIAMEKRKPIDDKLWFISGLEPGLGFATIADNSFLRVGLGYILGFQYDVSEAFYVNIETTPFIGTNLGENGGDSFLIDVAPNSSAAISVVYRFQKK
ncbi:MAG: hypothetical protein Roseis2KO_26400 [Roseivirga sp.]